MFRTSLIFLLFFICKCLPSAQTNLVINPSFEDISDCPKEARAIKNAFNWFSPTNGTPDLYNSCSSDPLKFTSVPIHQVFIYQLPKTGNGYAGILTYAYGGFIAGATREYLSAKLLKPLNKKYYVYFHVAPRKSKQTSDLPCFTDGIAMTFSKEKIDVKLPTNEPLPLVPKILNKGRIIKDTLKWEKVCGSFSGTGENYLVIGNFFNEAQTVIDNECFKTFPNTNYHYIDDVGVFEFDPLPDSLLLCEGESKKVGSKFLDGTYKWNTGETDSTIVITKAGKYSVTVTIDGCEISDTVIVLETKKDINALFRDTLICKGQTINLKIPAQGIFTWSNGQKGDSISIKTSGIYAVSITNDCGLFEGSFEVKVENCTCQIFIPNAFSPNNDGINDVLKCSFDCDFPYKLLDFQIFDRWGEKIYTTNSPDFDAINWDGSFNGVFLENGVYVWHIRYEYYRNNEWVQALLFGDINIIR